MVKWFIVNVFKASLRLLLFVLNYCSPLSPIPFTLGWKNMYQFYLKEPSKVKSETSHSPVDDEEGGVIESLVNKKKPSVQCEECYECFEDKEKLAWHNLNDH